ncbi:RsmB/NOP family class I SAM-dependent RNA methyltransferase [Paenibacillus sepulcri]
MLPQSFTDKMKIMLQGEYDDFIASYERPRKFGLRVNGLKLTAAAFAELSLLSDRLTRVPWEQGAFYYEEADRPGKHPHYHAGLYYIQEPSAMVPAELLGVLPGECVLDLCAAPGGKSTQLAAKLQGSGVLVANDNARERTKALAKNIELAGVRNAVILNEEPGRLAEVFEGWFDRILVDAPCSGEGMFRKDESMIAEWERHSVERCSVMQRDILVHASRMLAPGGTLVYSTCTFSPEENEAQIAALLIAEPLLEIVPIELAHGWAAGRPDWIGLSAAEAVGAVNDTDPDMERIAGRNLLIGQLGENAEAGRARLASISGTVRLWPHLTGGEGHYAAVLYKRKPVDADEQTSDGGRSGAVGAEPERHGGKSSHGGQLKRTAASKAGINEQEKSGYPQRPVHEERYSGAKRQANGAQDSRGQGHADERSRKKAHSRQGSHPQDSVRIHAGEKGLRGGRADKTGGISYGGKVARDDKRASAHKGSSSPGTAPDAAASWGKFAAEQLIGAEQWTGELVAYGSRVYLQPPGMPSLGGLRVVRAGWYIGEAGPHRFEPSQALALGLRRGEAALSLRLGADDEATLRYLKGETLHIDAERLVRAGEPDGRSDARDGDPHELEHSTPAGAAAKGYVLVCADDFPIGWGKVGGEGWLKNELPAGWRLI